MCQNPIGANTAPIAPPEFTGGRKQKVNGKGGLLWTVKTEKTLIFKAPQAPSFKPLSNEGKVLFAFILRRAELSRKNGWADEYGRIYLYYPICEVVALLHCGRQKAVNTLRELQYAGVVEIQKQGCGKPNRIYPKSYEAVPTADFKKSGCGTP